MKIKMEVKIKYAEMEQPWLSRKMWLPSKIQQLSP